MRHGVTSHMGLERSRSAADASRLSTNVEVKNDDSVSHKRRNYDSLKNNYDRRTRATELF